MNKTLASAFQIATLLLSVSAFAATEKGQHEGLLLDSRIKYADSGSREVESKVILNGDNWTLVTRTPQGNMLYGRTEKVSAAAAAATASAAAPVTASASAGAASNESAAGAAQPSTATVGNDTSSVAKPVASTSDNETIRVLYRETNDAGAEVGSSAAMASVGSPASIDLKDAHIESRVSKIRYQLE